MFQITIVFTGITVVCCVFAAAIGFVLYDAIQIMKRRTQTENKDE